MINKQKQEDIRSLFFNKLSEEFNAFRYQILSGTTDYIFKHSMKATFYKEVYTYLMDDVLSDNEYEEFSGEPIIQKLWDIFVVSELPRQNRDYLRQLINLHRNNIARAKGERNV